MRLPLLAATLLIAGASQAEGFRDPMRPPNSAPAAAPAPTSKLATGTTLKLEGVIAGEKRVAILNGRLARAGDVIAGAKILEVFATGVRYERNGKISTLTLAIAPANTSVRVARSDKE